MNCGKSKLNICNSKFQFCKIKDTLIFLFCIFTRHLFCIILEPTMVMYYSKKLVFTLMVFLLSNALLSAQNINIGITTSQSKKILGEPSYIDVTVDSTMSVKTVYIYSEELDYYYLEFNNDRIVVINPHPNYTYYDLKNQTPKDNPKVYINPNNYTSLPIYSKGVNDGKTMTMIGKSLFFTGLATSIAGGIMLANETDENKNTGSVLLGVGAIMYTVSIPLWIGGVERKHKNHYHKY